MKILRGYVLAYGLSGFVVDDIASKLQIEVDRDFTIFIIASNILLSITAISMLGIKCIKLLEK